MSLRPWLREVVWFSKRRRNDFRERVGARLPLPRHVAAKLAAPLLDLAVLRFHARVGLQDERAGERTHRGWPFAGLFVAVEDFVDGVLERDAVVFVVSGGHESMMATWGR